MPTDCKGKTTLPGVISALDFKANCQDQQLNEPHIQGQPTLRESEHHASKNLSGVRQATITSYPNNEIRIRSSVPVPSKARDSRETRELERYGKMADDRRVAGNRDSMPIRLTDSQPKRYKGDWVYSQLQRTDLTPAERLAYEQALFNGLYPNQSRISPASDVSSESSVLAETSQALDQCSDTSAQNLELVAGWGRLPGEKRLSLRMKRRLKRIGGVMSKRYRITLDDVRKPSDMFRLGLPKAILITFTLPGSTEASMRAISAYSGYIMNRLTTWVRDVSGATAEWFYSWEGQKRGALHPHMVIGADDLETLQAIIDGSKAKWCDILRDVGAMASVDLFERSASNGGGTWQDDPEQIQVDTQWLKGDIATYITKYATKAEKFHGYYPGQVAGCSRSLGKSLAEMTQTFTVPWLSEEQSLDTIGTAVEYMRVNELWNCAYQDKYGSGLTWVMYHPDDGNDYFGDICAMFPQSVEREESGAWGGYCSINPDRLRQEQAAIAIDRLEREQAVEEVMMAHADRDRWWNRPDKRRVERLIKGRQEFGLDLPF